MSNYVSIHRDSHSRNFTVISNQLIRNQDLSYQARFLLMWLLSFNPQEGYKFSLDKISGKTGIPISRTRTLIQELQAAGYLKLNRIREGNRFGCYYWDIYETPGNSNKAEQPSDNSPVEQPEVISESDYNFNRIWEAYPADKRGDKKEAKKAFNQIPEANDIIDSILKGLSEMKGKHNWRKEGGRWIPGLKTFLTNRIWEEGLENPTSAQGFKEMMMEAYNARI